MVEWGCWWGRSVWLVWCGWVEGMYDMVVLPEVLGGNREWVRGSSNVLLYVNFLC